MLDSRKSGTTRRNNPGSAQRPRCVFTSKEPHPRTGPPQWKTDPTDGVSTYLALTFGTLLSSQGTEASFETVSPVPPGFPSGDPDSIRPFPDRFTPEFPPASPEHTISLCS